MSDARDVMLEAPVGSYWDYDEDKLKTHTKDELKKWWKELNNDDRKEIESLPNYDEKIFLEAIGLGDDLDEE